MALNPWGGPVPLQIPREIDQYAEVSVEESPTFTETLSATIGYQYAPMLDALKNAFEYRDKVEVGYDPLTDMDGYKEFESFLINAQSRQHMSDLKVQIDENKQRREVLYKSSIPMQFAAGVFDPINLVALPFGGPALSLGRQFLKTGTSVATLQAGLEVARAPFDPLATPEESAMNIGSAFVTGGVIGTLLSIPATRRASTLKETNKAIDEFVNEVQSFTAEDLANVGNRTERKLGGEVDEVLNTRRTSLPKSIEALSKSIDEIKAKLDKKQIESPEEATKLADELKAKEQAKSRNENDLQDIIREQQYRRIEGINDGTITDAYGLVDNFFTSSWLYKGVTTPMKRILQGKIPSSIKEYTVKLAGDSGMILNLNKLGIATPKSVHQYASTRNGEWLKVYTDMLSKFGEHSKKGTSTIIDVNLSNLDGSFGTFLNEVNRKYINGEAGSSAAEGEAIKSLSNFYKIWEDRLIETGLIGTVKSMQARIINKEKSLDGIQAKITDLEQSFDRLKRGASVKQVDALNKLRTRYAAIEAEIIEIEIGLQKAKDDGVSPDAEEMFPRFWNRDSIRANRQEFARILYDWFKENPEIFESNAEAYSKSIKNISEMSDEEIVARYGAKFNVKRVVTTTKEKLKEVGSSPILGKFVYMDDGGTVYVDKLRAYNRYKQIKEAMQDPKKAYEQLNTLDPSTIQWHHQKFMLDNIDKFRTFNDFQDFVIAHELHHGVIKPRYKEDDINLEMRVNEEAINFVARETKDLRTRTPKFVKRTLPTDEKSIQGRVDSTIDEILGLSDVAADQNAFFGGGKSKHFRHRKLDIPNKLVFDYIQNDPLAVMRAYTQRVAPRYEFAKMFGGKTIDEVLDDIDTDMAAAGKSEKEINAVRRDFLHLHDRVVGSVLRDPTSWDQRAATVLRDLAQLNYLGSAGFSTLPDFAKIMMEHELKDVFRGLFATISDNRVRATAKEAQLSGEALEIIAGDAHMRLIDDVTNNPISEGAYQKNVGKLKWGFYMANLLAPMTNIMKKMDAVVRGHSLIQMSIRLSQGTASKFETTYLARYGIGKKEADGFKQLIDDGIIENTKPNGAGLWLPNTDKWPKQFEALRMEFRSSMNSGIMNTILMGTPADKPIITDGIVYVPHRIAKRFGYSEDPKFRGYSRIENGLLGLPFQFYSYTLASVNKITASYATGAVRNRAVGLVASMGLAYMGLELKNKDWVMDKMDLSDKIARSFDMSGVAALYSDTVYRAMETSMAMGGPDISMGLLSPKFPQEKNYVDAATSVLGAGPSIGVDLATGVGQFVTGEYGEGAKQIMRNLPLARLWIWKDFMNEASNSFTERRF